jgi:hypothetical protein
MKHPQLGTEEQQEREKAPGKGRFSRMDDRGGRIPWSAEGERALRVRIERIWELMWTFLLSGVLFVVLAHLAHKPVLTAFAGMSWGAGLFLLMKLNESREKLGEEMRRLPGSDGNFFEGSGMLANKPRSSQRLTEWVQWRASSDGKIGLLPHFWCSCGKMHRWSDAKWFPNVLACMDEFDDAPAIAVDPGGGRWVILCPCGIGHFKLNSHLKG